MKTNDLFNALIRPLRIFTGMTSVVKILISITLAISLASPAMSLAVESLTLAKAIKTALHNNPLILNRTNSLTATEKAKEGAWGELLPQVNSFASYSRLDDPMAVTPAKSASRPPDKFSRSIYSYGLNLKIPVYEGGRLWTQVSIAELSKAISEENLRFTRQDIIANTTNVFNRILYLNALIRARKETLTALEKLRDDARQRLSVGRIAPVDLMRIETQVASQKQALIDSREEQRRSRQTLSLLMGLDPSNLPTIAGILLPPHTYPIDRDKEVDLDSIIRNRPDVIRVTEEVKREEKKVRLAIGYHLPSFDIVGNYGKRAGAGFNGDEVVWSYGINISLNIFSGGVISSRVEEARANLLAARQMLRQTRLNAKTELLHAISRLRSARNRFNVAKRIRATARESFRIENLKYITGAGTITDSLISQAEWLSARANELSSLYDIHKALVDYRLSAGTIDKGWINTASK